MDELPASMRIQRGFARLGVAIALVFFCGIIWAFHQTASSGADYWRGTFQTYSCLRDAVHSGRLRIEGIQQTTISPSIAGCPGYYADLNQIQIQGIPGSRGENWWRDYIDQMWPAPLYGALLATIAFAASRLIGWVLSGFFR